MRSAPRWIVVAAVLLVVAVIAFFLLRKGGSKEGDEEAQVTATVTTAPVRQQTVQDLAPATGVIQPSAGNAITVASPRAAVVNRVFVAAGQAVQAGQPLVALANAPASPVQTQVIIEDLPPVARAGDPLCTPSNQTQSCAVYRVTVHATGGDASASATLQSIIH